MLPAIDFEPSVHMSTRKFHDKVQEKTKLLNILDISVPLVSWERSTTKKSFFVRLFVLTADKKKKQTNPKTASP